MAKSRFRPVFKAEAIKQITECGYSVKGVPERLAASGHSLYSGLKQRCLKNVQYLKVLDILLSRYTLSVVYSS